MIIKSGLRPVDEGNYLRCDSVKLGKMRVNAAFYLDNDGNYRGYELESGTGSLDSLDRWIRPLADSMAGWFEHRLGRAPEHIYRIGRFDIVQGNLAIYKLWNLPEASVYVGLATYKYRYYAKAIVSSNNQKQ